MGYKYEPIKVDLSEFGEGLQSTILHPRLLPNKDFQKIGLVEAKMARAMSKLDFSAEVKAAFENGTASFDTLPLDAKLALLPLVEEQMQAQNDLVSALVLEWNLTDVITGEPVEIPRKAGKDALDWIPGAIVAAIYAEIQRAAEAGVDPTSQRPSSS